MWIFAYTLNLGNNQMHDAFELHETKENADYAFQSMLNDEQLHCACIGPIIAATEPHWVTP